MTAAYESTNVAGLYFAGALSHALDFGQSAGGFIHGFRYTSRALTRYLNVQNHGGAWPMVTLTGKTHALKHVLQRVNTASSLYQMYGTLADVILIDTLQKSNNDSSNEELIDVLNGAGYFKDVPLKMVREGRFSFNMDARFSASKTSKLIATVTLSTAKICMADSSSIMANLIPQTGVGTRMRNGKTGLASFCTPY
jgi:hypothetical protein